MRKSRILEAKPHQHKPARDGCAICRLEALGQDAAKDDGRAALAVYKVAASAIRILEQLKKERPDMIREIMVHVLEWPSMCSIFDEGATHGPDELGSKAAHLPISWRRAFDRKTVPRVIMFRLFNFIAALRAHEADTKRQLTAKKAVELRPRNRVEHLAELHESSPDVFQATVEKLASQMVEHQTPPELSNKAPKSTRTFEDFAELCRALEIKTPRIVSRCVKQFSAQAAAIPSSTGTHLPEWQGLAEEILRFITGDDPSSNRVLRTLAPGREKHKETKSGAIPKGTGDINTRIFERLRGASTKMQEQ